MRYAAAAARLRTRRSTVPAIEDAADGGRCSSVEATLQQLREVAATAFADAPVTAVVLFGSVARRLAGRDLAEARDLDVAVLTEGGEPDLLDLLGRAGALERAAGVGELDLVLLDDAPPRLVARVLRDRMLLHAPDPAGWVRFEDEAGRVALDHELVTAPLDAQLLAGRAARARRYRPGSAIARGAAAGAGQ